LNPAACLHIISRASSDFIFIEKIMGLRKVTLFDKEGTTLVPVDEDGQAKPAVMGVRWVNPDTFETIRVVGGKRTGPKNEVLMEIPPTLDTSAFAIEDLPPPKVKEELKEIEKSAPAGTSAKAKKS
jgi:hypothetical protein